MTSRTVALVTLGCARNEVDSEELAGRLAAEGWTLVDDAADADVAVVNTCGFVEQAKKDSIDTLLEAVRPQGRAGRTQAVVAVGCLAERYGEQLAAELPEADAVLGLRLLRRHVRATCDAILHGDRPGLARAARPPHAAAAQPGRAGPARHARSGAAVTPRSPARPGPAERASAPASGPRVAAPPARRPAVGAAEDRSRLRPALRVLRDPDVPRRVRLPPPGRRPRRGPLAGRAGRRASCSWSARTPRRTARTSATCGCSRRCCPSWPPSTGIERVRVSYLQPAEIRPGLLDAMASTPGVVPYFDLSFQHASAPLLRRMRRFGDREALPRPARPGPRAARPLAGVRSQRHRRLPRRDRGRPRRARARSWSRPGSTWSACSATPTRTAPRPRRYDGKLAPRTSSPSGSRDSPPWSRSSTASAPRSASARRVEVLVEEVDATTTTASAEVGRAAHQGPEVDGVDPAACPTARRRSRVGDLVRAVVVGSRGRRPGRRSRA